MQVVSNSPNAGQAELTLAEAAARPVDAAARRWVPMGGESNTAASCPRPRTRCARREKGLLAERYTSTGSFEWLFQTTTNAAETEVNVQTGEFTLRRNQARRRRHPQACAAAPAPVDATPPIHRRRPRLCSFDAHARRVKLLSEKVQRDPDFVAATGDVFGKLAGPRRLHCAQLSATQHRRRCGSWGPTTTSRRGLRPSPPAAVAVAAAEVRSAC